MGVSYGYQRLPERAGQGLWPGCAGSLPSWSWGFDSLRPLQCV